MAKNRKTERRQQAESGTRQSAGVPVEHPAEQRTTQVTPADVAHKGRQKRFGHN
ncbi:MULTISPECIES: hypothetical protein [Streptomyces]|uniref:Small hydrophilic protein n=1 Tax=Streptomyces sudanensis TaxID=436397 RepID=A0ABY4T9X2_9ACTN|nr:MULTISPECIES: hypothetical protein [Streptomyces]MCP9959339.1 hypothetical protein [Streptomyces sudanensis]MCP9988415.1 hypothetical protein [Streptomyces sudanensis]MCQ0000202.1 hypothetical protein [Streptomyces sudanensis]URN15765.1 hypothetical protein MW084_07120 [Streptomyces sudanensis]